MKLFRAGEDDTLIEEIWFCVWFLCACLGAFLLWKWAGVLWTVGAINVIRARRSL